MMMQINKEEKVLPHRTTINKCRKKKRKSQLGNFKCKQCSQDPTEETLFVVLKYLPQLLINYEGKKSNS